MFWFILIVILVLVAWGFAGASKAKAARDQLAASFTAAHEGWDVFVSPVDEGVIAINHDHHKIIVGSLQSYVEKSWAEISSVEIEKNGQSITQTNRGSQALGAAAGALLLGPAGLLIGGLTGSKRHVEKIAHLTLKVCVDDRTRPLHRLTFLKLPGDGVKADSALLLAPTQRLEHCHAVLANAIRSQSQTPTVNPVSNPNAVIEDRIASLWRLKESGALTETEFLQQKANLLTPKLG